MRERYKDQDDEDRQLRMQLLAVTINVPNIVVIIDSNSLQVILINSPVGGTRRRMIRKVAILQAVKNTNTLRLKSPI